MMSGLLPEPVFAQRLPKDILEEGDLFSPQFNERGLIPAITQTLIPQRPHVCVDERGGP